MTHTNGARLWHETRAVRNPLSAGRWRHGRSVSCPRYPPRPRCRRQGAPRELILCPNLRQRLEREAKAVSKISHPHICTLHDIGHQDGMDYLIMELLEGETLEQRLTKGP